LIDTLVSLVEKLDKERLGIPLCASDASPKLLPLACGGIAAKAYHHRPRIAPLADMALHDPPP
jgi:hypothetical protein